MMDLVEGMVVAAIRDALGGNFVVKVGDHTVDLTPPWPRVTMSDLIEQKLGVRMDPTMPVEEARAILDGLHIEWENGWGSGKLMKQVVDEKIQHNIVNPIFCIDYPARGLAARPRAPLASRLRRAFRAHGRRLRAVQRLQRAERRQAAAGRVRDGGAGQGRGRSRGRRRRLRLRARPRIRHAVHRRSGHRHRPARDAAVRGRQHPRGHPLPDHAAGEGHDRTERTAAGIEHRRRARPAASSARRHRRRRPGAGCSGPGRACRGPAAAARSTGSGGHHRGAPAANAGAASASCASSAGSSPSAA